MEDSPSRLSQNALCGFSASLFVPLRPDARSVPPRPARVRFDDGEDLPLFDGSHLTSSPLVHAWFVP
jgi:hypothetical protein